MQKSETLSEFIVLFNELAKKEFLICFPHSSDLTTWIPPDTSSISNNDNNSWEYVRNSFRGLFVSNSSILVGAKLGRTNVVADNSINESFSLQYLCIWYVWLKYSLPQNLKQWENISKFREYVNRQTTCSLKDEEKSFILNSFELLLNEYYLISAKYTEGEKHIKRIFKYFSMLLENIRAGNEDDHLIGDKQKRLTEKDIEYQLLFCYAALLEYKFASIDEEESFRNEFNQRCDALNVPLIWRIALARKSNAHVLLPSVEAEIPKFKASEIATISLHSPNYDFIRLFEEKWKDNSSFKDHCYCQYHHHHDDDSRNDISNCKVLWEFYLHSIEYIVTNNHIRNLEEVDVFRYEIIEHYFQFLQRVQLKNNEFSKLQRAKALAALVIQNMNSWSNYAYFSILNHILRCLIYELQDEDEEFWMSTLLSVDGWANTIQFFLEVDYHLSILFDLQNQNDGDIDPILLDKLASPINILECSLIPKPLNHELKQFNRNHNFTENYSLLRQLVQINRQLISYFVSHRFNDDSINSKSTETYSIFTKRIKEEAINNEGELSFKYLLCDKSIIDLYSTRLSKIGDLKAYPVLYTMISTRNISNDITALEEFFGDNELMEKYHFGSKLRSLKTSFIKEIFSLPPQSVQEHYFRWCNTYFDFLISEERALGLELLTTFFTFTASDDADLKEKEESLFSILRYYFRLNDASNFDNLIDWFISSRNDMKFTFSIPRSKSQPDNEDVFQYISSYPDLCRVFHTLYSNLGSLFGSRQLFSETVKYIVLSFCFKEMSPLLFDKPHTLLGMLLDLLLCEEYKIALQIENLIIDFAINFDSSYSSLYIDSELQPIILNSEGEDGDDNNKRAIRSARSLFFKSVSEKEMLDFFISLKIKLGTLLTYKKKYSLALEYLSDVFDKQVVSGIGTSQKQNIFSDDTSKNILLYISLVTCNVHLHQPNLALNIIKSVEGNSQLHSVLSKLYHSLTSTPFARWNPSIHRFYSSEFNSIANTLLVLHLRSSSSVDNTQRESNNDNNDNNDSFSAEDNNYFAIVPLEVIHLILTHLSTQDDYQIQLSPSLSSVSSSATNGGNNESVITWNSPFCISAQNILDFVAIHPSPTLFFYSNVKTWYEMIILPRIFELNPLGLFENSPDLISPNSDVYRVSIGENEFLTYRMISGAKIQLMADIVDFRSIPKEMITIESIADLLSFCFMNINQFSNCMFSHVDDLIAWKLDQIKENKTFASQIHPEFYTYGLNWKLSFILSENNPSSIALCFFHDFNHSIVDVFHDSIVFLLKIVNFFRLFVFDFLNFRFADYSTSLPSSSPSLFIPSITKPLSFLESTIQAFTLKISFLEKSIDGVSTSNVEEWSALLMSIAETIRLKSISLLKLVINELKFDSPNLCLSVTDLIAQLNAALHSIMKQNIPRDYSDYSSFFFPFCEVILFLDYVFFFLRTLSPSDAKQITDHVAKEFATGIVDFENEEQVIRQEDSYIFQPLSTVFSIIGDHLLVMSWFGNEILEIPAGVRLLLLITVLSYHPPSRNSTGFCFQTIGNGLVFSNSFSLKSDVDKIIHKITKSLSFFYSVRKNFVESTPSTLTREDLFAIFHI